MDIIVSTQNQHVKEARALQQKKHRDESNCFLVEGGNIFKDMPETLRVKKIFCTPERASEISKIVARSSVEVYYVNDSVMQSLSDTVTPYGIVAVIEKNLQDFRLPKGNALLLDGVSDPGNLGTIIRTAVATNFLDIYLLNTVDIYSPKVVRSTLGGLFKVNLFEVNSEDAINLVKNTNSFVLDMDGVDITKSNLKDQVLLVAGNEAHGVRKELVDAASNVLSLPMQNGIESLNVAIATAVAMYQTI